MFKYKSNKDSNDPTKEDLEKWQKAYLDLMDHVNTGITGFIQKLGHKKIHKLCKNYLNAKILEIGCGYCHHLKYATNKYNNYIGLDIREDFLKEVRKRYPEISVITGDAKKIPFNSEQFDVVLSIYNLEHIKDLDLCFLEIKRILKKDGIIIVGLPLEGGFLYNLGREFTTKPYMEKKYKIDYDAIIKYEHCNEIWDILPLLKKYFVIEKTYFIPFGIKTFHLNAIVVFKMVNK